jgi:hypothetical protein
MSNDQYQQKSFWNKKVKKKASPKCESGKKIIKEIKDDNKIIRHREWGG